MTRTVSPFLTVWPALTRTSAIVPVISGVMTVEERGSSVPFALTVVV